MSNVPPESRLLYRRQFVLGPRLVPKFRHWPYAPIGPDFCVQTHADLPLYKANQNNIDITLLGYVIDPSAPESDNEEILHNLASRCSSAKDAPNYAHDLCGRWVMIVRDEHDIIMFNDPCGLREAFFTDQNFDEFWCASQPTRIAAILDLDFSTPANNFMQSRFFEENHEPWWPAGTTPYDGIARLQPNHFLDLRSCKLERFWPSEPIQKLPLERAVGKAADRLRNSVRAASYRFPLALPITAGFDSRTVMAATKDIDDIWHYTALRNGLTKGSSDVRTPGRLLRKLGCKHNVIECPIEMSERFAKIYQENTLPAHDSAGAIALGILPEYRQERVSLSGHCSEIVRDVDNIIHRDPAPSASRLAEIELMHDEPFAIEHFQNWIDRSQSVVESSGCRLLELFYWEQEWGCWGANGQSQWDLVHERFTPFNDRELLQTLLGVELRFRGGPDYTCHRRIIELLWPELLSEPFNRPESQLFARIKAKALKVLPFTIFAKR
jgi:hypothetical protein